MITLINYPTIRVVVKNTIIEKIKVQIGSAILYYGLQRIIAAAIMTPKL